ncbi:MAG: hypothetical protein JWP75_3128, partial [Frondihabitans sp.]|nr:hypothetical protein [Frondihabitans sp.]
SDLNTYTYFIYADNGYFCTASSPASVQSLQAPSGVSATAAVVDRGDSSGYFDVQISGLQVTTGTAQSYVATNTGSGASITVQNGDFLTSSADQSVYGLAQTWTVKACRTSDGNICSTDTATISGTPVSTRASIGQCTVGAALAVNAPANDHGVTPDGYTVDFNEPFLGIDHWVSNDSNGNAFTTTSTVPTSATQVRVKATVQGHQDPTGAIADCTAQ